MKKIRKARHCLSPAERGAMPSVPGLSQVLTACDFLTTSSMTSVSVSIASSERNSELLALASEAAEQSGLRMDCERRGHTLVLRFAKERSG
jgi:hypothetical protein